MHVAQALKKDLKTPSNQPIHLHKHAWLSTITRAAAHIADDRLHVTCTAFFTTAHSHAVTLASILFAGLYVLHDQWSLTLPPQSSLLFPYNAHTSASANQGQLRDLCLNQSAICTNSQW